MIPLEKYTGCFTGLAIGDALGAAYEGGYIERLLWKIIGKTKNGKHRYTDDTQMSIDLANSFIANKQIVQDHLAATFAESYRWSRGYGPSTATLLKKIQKGCKWQDVNRIRFKDGSYGNGAAMRAPIVALCFPNSQNTLKDNVHRSSEITHAHPLAIEGAQLIAFITYTALHDWTNETILREFAEHCSIATYKEKLAACLQLLRSNEHPDNKLLRKTLGNAIAASDSSVTAIYFSLKYRHQPLFDMLSQIYRLGGDTDTIGAMAGAIWGAFNGIHSIPENLYHAIENSPYIIELARQLYAVQQNRNGAQ